MYLGYLGAGFLVCSSASLGILEVAIFKERDDFLHNNVF